MSNHNYPNYNGSQPCASIGIELFYHEYEAAHSRRDAREDHEALSKVCSDCTFLVECAAYAIYHEEFGYWGGMSPNERTAYRRKHGIVLDKYSKYGK